MKDYPQIISRMKGSLWLIEETSLQVILDIVNRHMSGEILDEEEILARIEAAESGDRSLDRVEVGGGVGIIPLYGPIFAKSNLMTQLSGATSLEQWRSDFLSLVGNEKVESIVMDIDSPGGTSDMVEELGNEIRAAREIKPVYAVANTMACSAAHWLGSQASKFFVTNSGKVGSIGVYTVREDTSEQAASEGRKTTLISAGKFKTALNPEVPFTEEAREYVQEHVDELHGKFIDAVAQGRNVDRSIVERYAEGKVYSATQAAKLGMVDGVKTMDAVVTGLLADHSSQSVGPTISAAMARFRLNAADDLATRLDLEGEYVELEHSEPGTGSPPEPREQNRGDAPKPSGSRRDTPPIAKELEMEELEGMITSLREAGVEVPDTVTDVDGLNQFILSMHSELAPLREAREAAEARQTFRQQFPEEAARLEALESRDREHNAEAFAASFERFQKPDSNEKLPTGFSAAVLEMVEKAHLSISARTFTHADLGELLSKIGGGGIVDYSEHGSRRTGTDDGPTHDDPRKQFASRVQALMDQDNLEYKVALAEAAKQYPEEFAAYREPPMKRS